MYITSLKPTNFPPEKWMVGIRSFRPFAAKAYFSGAFRCWGDFWFNPVVFRRVAPFFILFSVENVLFKVSLQIRESIRNSPPNLQPMTLKSCGAQSAIFIQKSAHMFFAVSKPAPTWPFSFTKKKLIQVKETGYSKPLRHNIILVSVSWYVFEQVV